MLRSASGASRSRSTAFSDVARPRAKTAQPDGFDSPIARRPISLRSSDESPVHASPVKKAVFSVMAPNPATKSWKADHAIIGPSVEGSIAPASTTFGFVMEMKSSHAETTTVAAKMAATRRDSRLLDMTRLLAAIGSECDIEAEPEGPHRGQGEEVGASRHRIELVLDVGIEARVIGPDLDVPGGQRHGRRAGAEEAAGGALRNEVGQRDFVDAEEVRRLDVRLQHGPGIDRPAALRDVRPEATSLFLRRQDLVTPHPPLANLEVALAIERRRVVEHEILLEVELAVEPEIPEQRQDGGDVPLERGKQVAHVLERVGDDRVAGFEIDPPDAVRVVGADLPAVGHAVHRLEADRAERRDASQVEDFVLERGQPRPELPGGVLAREHLRSSADLQPAIQHLADVLVGVLDEPYGG